MERKDFIKRVTLAAVSLSLFESAKTEMPNCVETPDDEEGPFPTKKPGTLISKNITSDRRGTPLTINITVNNINNKCLALAGATVDLWHCDSEGAYSEYGGSGVGGMPPPRMEHKDGNRKPSGKRPPMREGGLQTADHTSEHFLRGRQVTNAEGIASFTSIYPGWYPGRAPHLHLHIFNANGKSILITQVAFPENVTHEVYANGVYTSHGFPDTSNSDDHVFEDSIANEMAAVTGSIKDGYNLAHSIYVKA